MTTYTEGVFNDKNKLKRWLQYQRLQSALEMIDSSMLNAKVVLDFGAANGELCKYLSAKFSTAKVICYEPAPSFMEEAKVNLLGMSNVEFVSKIDDVALNSVDLVFCLEVFEHIPDHLFVRTINEIKDKLISGGNVVFGVPVEVGLPALYKGLFRMSRRYGAFDAVFANVVRATFGVPPKLRPLGEIAPGLVVHHEHLGFDHRKFRKEISKIFKIRRESASPFPFFQTWLNPEAYYLVSTGKD